jgi:hypothetical protein
VLQVLLDDLGLPREIGHVPVDDLDESGESLNLLGELVGKLLLFLVAPRPLQRGQLPVERLDPLLGVAAELLQALGKPPQFFGIQMAWGMSDFGLRS